MRFTSIFPPRITSSPLGTSRDFKLGKIHIYKGFTSTALEKGAVNFGSTAGLEEANRRGLTPVILKIQSKRGKPVYFASSAPGEWEILFQPNTHFKVIKSSISPEVARVELEELIAP